MIGGKPKKRIRITRENLGSWPSFEKLLAEEKVRFDSEGRLRYSHGAPVGDMILVRVSSEGETVYRESAENWFDPDSPMADSFEWE